MKKICKYFCVLIMLLIMFFNFDIVTVEADSLNGKTDASLDGIIKNRERLV